MKHEAARAEPPTTRTTDQRIYQLTVSLQDVHPPIWRRFQVPADYNLQDLHEVLQIVMGWESSHPYQLLVGATYYGETELERGRITSFSFSAWPGLTVNSRTTPWALSR